jgi:hypothetical protein
MKTICLFFAALLAAISPAAATTTMFGLQQTAAASCTPFGCGTGGSIGWVPEFQQVYLGSALSCAPSCTITEISFVVGTANVAGTGVGVVNSGTYTISLSTTSASVMDSNFHFAGLNVSNLSANIGADNTVVYSGALPAISGGVLTIVLQSPFVYHSALGNLLLDVQSSNPTNPGSPFMYLRLATNQTFWGFSSAYTGIGTNNYDSALGLITTFVY